MSIPDSGHETRQQRALNSSEPSPRPRLAGFFAPLQEKAISPASRVFTDGKSQALAQFSHGKGGTRRDIQGRLAQKLMGSERRLLGRAPH